MSITYKLSRFFYAIFNPKMSVSYIVANVLSIIQLFTTDDNPIIAYFFFMIVLNGSVFLVSFLNSPKEFTSYENYIKLYEYIYLKPKLPRFVIIRGGYFWLKVTYYVSDIKDVCFYQNRIEKLFDIGHISFVGNAVFDAKRDLDRIKEKNSFNIYGIKNFTHFKSHFSYK